MIKNYRIVVPEGRSQTQVWVDEFYLVNGYHKSVGRSGTKYIKSIKGSIALSPKRISSELLLRFGIIDDSHLAIVPSALIYEYSPVILRKILGDSLEVHLHGIQTKPMDWNKNNRIAKTFEEHPLPVTRLSRISPNSPWRKDTKKRLIF